MAPEELIVWTEFLNEPSARLREQLINRYSRFANILAAKLFRHRQVQGVEFDEFKQYALVGLIESVDRYDLIHAVSFETFAAHRIKGSILNGIEKYSEQQQQIIARARIREDRLQDLLREASAEQVDPFMRLVDVAIGMAVGYMLEDSGMYQGHEQPQDHEIYRGREMRDLSRVLSSFVEKLPEVEKRVIKAHYFQRQRFDHIAEELALTKGRVSQIHHRALRRLLDNYDELKLLRQDY